jgi:hypothetical protein
MEFKTGDRVETTIKKMVPHPEGKTDRLGEVLPVLRDVKVKATVCHGGNKEVAVVKVDGRPYEQSVPLSSLTLIS